MYDFESNYFDLEIKTRHEAESSEEAGSLAIRSSEFLKRKILGNSQDTGLLRKSAEGGS